jgi:thiol:disulfide interchange protein
LIFEILVYALLGGLFLNILPCVLPVIPIKILSFINQAQESLAVRLKLAGAYSLGIITSFLLLGGICTAALLMGSFLGFGFHMTNPWFNAIMALFMAGFGLHLSGAWAWAKKRIYKPTIDKSTNQSTSGSAGIDRSIWGKLSGLAGIALDWFRTRSPTLKSFGEGVLTTALGSACTGPFLALAMGTAVMLSPYLILGAFGAAGIGMALPYMLLAFLPSLIKKTPKAGGWITMVKRGCGVLLLGVAVWFGYLAWSLF